MIKIREQILSSQDDATFVDLLRGLHMPVATPHDIHVCSWWDHGWAPGGSSSPGWGQQSVCSCNHSQSARGFRSEEQQEQDHQHFSHPGADGTLHPHEAGGFRAAKEPRAHRTSIIWLVCGADSGVSTAVSHLCLECGHHWSWKDMPLRPIRAPPLMLGYEAGSKTSVRHPAGMSCRGQFLTQWKAQWDLKFDRRHFFTTRTTQAAIFLPHFSSLTGSVVQLLQEVGPASATCLLMDGKRDRT